jgi:hypothetical protein
LIKIPVKYFNLFSTILQRNPNFSIVIMISATISTRPQSFIQLGRGHFQHGRIIPME